MKSQFYFLLPTLVLTLMGAGIFVALALQNGLAVQWIAAACSGLTGLMILARVFWMMGQNYSSRVTNVS